MSFRTDLSGVPNGQVRLLTSTATTEKLLTKFGVGPFMSRERSLPEVIIIIVVAVLAAAVIAPNFMRPSRRYPATNACIANLKQIQASVEQWALENKLTPTNRVSLTNISGGSDKMLKQSINAELKCPAGGTYSVTTVGENPRCSILSHTL